MSPVEIEAFLAIKRQIIRARWLQAGVAALVVIIVITALLANRGDRDVLNMALGAAIGGVLVGIGSRADAARDRLIELVDRQINRDPAALRYLAQQLPSR